MIIKKCDVCKNETDALYDKMIATHTDTINNVQYIRQDKLHICRVCMKAITEVELQAQLGWYEDNTKEVEEEPTENTGETGDDNGENTDGEEPNGNNEQTGEDAGGTTTGD